MDSEQKKISSLKNKKKLDFFNLKITFATIIIRKNMYWTLELANYLADAPWPASKDELIDYAIRTGAPLEVVENLQSLEEEGEVYDDIVEIWPDYPTEDDYLWNEEEY